MTLSTGGRRLARRTVRFTGTRSVRLTLTAPADSLRVELRYLGRAAASPAAP